MEAKQGDTVEVHYTGKLENGELFDSSSNTEPVQFTIGAGEVMPGFEEAVVGMSPGESKTWKVDSDKAFGPHHETMVVTVEREKLPQDMEPKVGQVLQAGSGEKSVSVRVVEISGDRVTLDANHPLAGRDLLLDIKLEKIVERPRAD